MRTVGPGRIELYRDALGVFQLGRLPLLGLADPQMLSLGEGQPVLNDWLILLSRLGARLHEARSEEAILTELELGLRAQRLFGLVSRFDAASGTLTRMAAPSDRRRATALGATEPLRGDRISLEQSELASRVVRSGETVYLAEIGPELEQLLVTLAPSERIRSRQGAAERAVLAPVVARGRVLGLLVVVGPVLAEAHVEALQVLGMHLGLALEDATLHQDLRQAILREHARSNALRRLEHVVGELSSESRAELIWQRVVEAAASALGVERAAIYLAEESGSVLAALAGSSTWFGPAVRQLPPGAAGGPVGMAIEAGATLIVEDVRVDASWAPLRDAPELRWVRSLWAVPIISDQGEHLGALAFFSDRVGAPNAEDVELARRFAFHGARALAEHRTLATDVQLARTEALATIARSLPHELGQPLSVISGYAELISEGFLQGDQLRDACTDIVSAVRELADRVQRLERLSTFVTKEYGPGRAVIDLERSGEQSPEDAD